MYIILLKKFDGLQTNSEINRQSNANYNLILNVKYYAIANYIIIFEYDMIIHSLKCHTDYYGDWMCVNIFFLQ